MHIRTVELNFDKQAGGIDLTDITRPTEHSVVESKMNDGIVVVQVVSRNVCVSTTEYEPGMKSDIKAAMERLGANMNGHANEHANVHAAASPADPRASLVGSTVTVPFKDNRLMLGKWQQIVLIDFNRDTDRRKVIVQIIGD